MPTYEYQCEKCQQTFEAFQSMKDAPYTVCPKELCRQAAWGEGKVKRLLGTGAG
jgi:putative FmdB family regulatory protein